MPAGQGVQGSVKPPREKVWGGQGEQGWAGVPLPVTATDRQAAAVTCMVRTQGDGVGVQGVQGAVKPPGEVLG
jgi:hypothetical protein